MQNGVIGAQCLSHCLRNLLSSSPWELNGGVSWKGGPFHLLLDFGVGETLFRSPTLVYFNHISKKFWLYCRPLPHHTNSYFLQVFI